MVIVNWSCGPILPPSLIDLREKTAEEVEEDEDEEEEQEVDYDEFLNDDDLIYSSTMKNMTLFTTSVACPIVED